MAKAAVIVLAFWLNAGAQPFQAEALVQQAKIESRLSPDPPQTGFGHCLYQWAGARWQQLQAWAHSRGCPPLQVQLRFARLELAGPWFSCFWQASPATALAVLRRHFGRGSHC